MAMYYLRSAPLATAASPASAQVGAEELDAESYRTASDMRSRLQEASRCRGALEGAVKALGRGLRQEDAEAVERALGDAAK